MLLITFIVVLLLPAVGWAAPDCADPSPGTLVSNSPSTSVSVSYTTRSGSDQITYFAYGGRKTAFPTFSAAPQIGGQTMTQLGTNFHNSSATFGAIWYKVNPPAGTNNVTATISTTAPTNTNYIVWTCNNADTSSPHRSNDEQSGVSTTPSSTPGTVDSTDTVVDYYASDYSGTLPSVGASQTVIQNTESGSSTGGTSYQSGAAGGAMTWTLGASDDWVSLSWALKAAPAGAAGGVMIWMQ